MYVSQFPTRLLKLCAHLIDSSFATRYTPSQLVCFCNTPRLVLCEWKHLADICCVLRELRVSHNELPGVAKLIGVCTGVVSCKVSSAFKILDQFDFLYQLEMTLC